MKTKKDLKDSLTKIDHKSYKCYKSLEDEYNFDNYILSIDHVQGDPFATPSRVRLLINNNNNFPTELFNCSWRKIALEDYLLRELLKFLRKETQNRRGSGKSGLVTACSVSEEVLERIAVIVTPALIEVRLEVGFPAYGRTIAAKELENIIFSTLPDTVYNIFNYSKANKISIKKCIELSDDQEFIRNELKRLNLIAFVADGSILPRESGVSKRPLKSAIKFSAPKGMAVTLELPHYGALCGMVIRPGINLIVGGGYHGKSTLLKSLEAGVYNHILGDGREYVITDSTAVKLRAEEGRSIHNVDISMFINNLPNKTDTHSFSTENASGSTSQAANTVEAIASESNVFLIDEDTSATNFMIRDSVMAQLVTDNEEPITPFIKCVRSLYEDHGISSIIVIGSSGAYLSVADTVIQMKEYIPYDVTDSAKKLASPMDKYKVNLVNPLNNSFKKLRITKIKVHGIDTLSFDRTDLDLRGLEQIADSGQSAGLLYLVKYCLENIADGKHNSKEIADKLYEIIERKGFCYIIPKGYGSGCPVLPRKQELIGCLQRFRGI